MELFQKDGHLSNTAILALIHNEAMSDLERLEAAEHLSYCDSCLHRYTLALSASPLLMPQHSCRQSLFRRIRARAIRAITSRYATAAAAVAVALTLLWADFPLPDDFTAHFPEGGSYETLLPKQWSDSFSLLSEHLNSFFKGHGGPEDGGNTT